MEKEWPAKGGPEDVSRLRREASDVETAPERLIELSADSELRLLVAANVSTSAAHLEELSKDESEQVRRVVAQNPNVSLPCLLALASEFPAEFFLNPLCSLLNLAQPGWYTQIEDLTWLSLLRYAQIPRFWLNLVEEQKKHKGRLTNIGARQPRDPYGVWVAARLHVALPELHANGEHIGRDLADSVAVVARHGRTPGPLLAELASIVCQYGHVKEIGDAVCEQIRRSVAQNVAAPQDVLRILARDVDPKVRYRVGENPRTPVDVLEQLAADTLAYVRSGVAANPATPPALLKHLAFNKSYEEKYEQIIRQREPEENNEFKKRQAQAQEAENNIKLVKGALAGNEATPAHVLRELASHPEVTVRERLAANPSAPEDVLSSLATGVDQVLWTMVEQNPRTSAEALAQSALRKTARIRIAVASHPHTPGEILAHLARDSHVRVREAVAKNPYTPVEALVHLARDGEGSATASTIVREAVAKNPATPRKLLARLAGQHKRDITIALAKNLRLPAELIQQLLTDEEKKARQQIASHPRLSLSDLECLARDSDPEIQQLAQKRLERWHALGERGQQMYAFRGDLDDSEKPGLRLGTPESIPFYEIQRRAGELRNPYVLLNFLAHFQFGAAERQEIFASFLPTWAPMWKDHPHLWIDLLAEFDLPVEWQRIFAISPYWLVRYALAVQSDTATEQLTTLAGDGNRYVRAAARWYLQQRQEE